MKIKSSAILRLGLLTGSSLMLCISSDATEKKYNVLFIISDEHKKEVTGCYGDKIIKTPNIDELARHGIIFNNFYTPSPLCAPARASLLTGLYPYANGVLYHKEQIKDEHGDIKETEPGHYRDGYKIGLKTIGVVFRSNGYNTAAIGKMHVHGELQKNVNDQFPEGNDMGFDVSDMRYYTYFPGGHYSDYKGEDIYERYREFKNYAQIHKSNPLNSNYLPTLVEDYNDIFDIVVEKKCADYITKCGSNNKPFFVYVGLEKPHQPWTTAQRYLDMYNPADFKLPISVDDWEKNGKFPWILDWNHNSMPVKQPEKAKNAMAAYYACVTEVDDMVGKLIKTLKETGTYENTIIIYTTDHGEHLFEKGLIEKHNMFESASNIPFIISCPGLFPENKTCNSNASLIDVIPTLCDILGFDSPEGLQGRSFYDDLMTGKTVKDVPVFSEFYEKGYSLFPNVYLPTRMVRVNDMKFIYTHGMTGQLYDLGSDREEEKNLYDQPGNYLDRLRLEVLTLHQWNLQNYPLIEAKINSIGGKMILKWKSGSQGSRFIVLSAHDSNPMHAEILAKDIEQNEFVFVPRDRGKFFWVLEEFNYQRNCPRFPEKKMVTNEVPGNLPCSNTISLSD